MNRKKHKVVYDKTVTGVNINTSPHSVSHSFDFDLYDYFVDAEMLTTQTTNNNPLAITFNNDTGSNYRRYLMVGSVTTAVATVSDTVTYISLFQNYSGSGGKTPRARMMLSRASSSDELYATSLAANHSTVNSRIEVHSQYWKNKADAVSSLEFRHVIASINGDYRFRIYQIPKKANLDNYDLVEAVDFVASSSDIVFSGLDGDADGEYLLEFDCDDRLTVEVNSDSGLNYIEQRLYNLNGAINSQNASQNAISAQGFKSFVKINATSGRKRIATATASIVQTVSEWEQTEQATWWSNTADNITSLTVTSLSSTTGSVKLYRRKSNKTIDPVPMETLVEIPVNGDLSSGVTLLNLEGDRINGAMKIEFVGEGPELRYYFNGDQTANYTNQYLSAFGSGAGAGVSTVGYHRLKATSVGNTSHGVSWLYSMSGQNRPTLNENEHATNGIFKYASWYNNSVDEINSMTIYQATAGTSTGTIRISVPKGTKMASPSAILTVN